MEGESAGVPRGVPSGVPVGEPYPRELGFFEPRRAPRHGRGVYLLFMRRGQVVRYSGPGFTKAQLMESGGISAGIFDAIRKASRVKGPGHGGLDWLFPTQDVRRLIVQCRKGTHTERGGEQIAQAWEALLAGRT